MKKLVYILAIIAAPLILNSCQDAYDIDRHGFVDPTTGDPYINMNDVQNGLNDVYSRLDNSSQIGLASIWVDECGIGYANGGQGLSDGQYGFLMGTTNDYASSIWYSNYSVINSVNRFIEGTTIFKDKYGTDSENSEVDALVGQAKVLRAYAYLDLLTYFSTDMTDDNALGVINMGDLVPYLEDGINLPRVSNGEIFAEINQNLDEAAAVIDSDPTDVYYVNINTIEAIRARMALYRGHYAEAITHSQNLINNFPLSPRSQFRAMFFTNQIGESIFKLKRTPGQAAIGRTWSSVNTSLNGSPFYEIGRSLFNLLNEDDIRYSVLLNTGSIVDPNYQTSSDYRNTDILLIGKYKGTSTPNDLMIFRAGEMYLIKAEAQANLNLLTDAANTLQEIRNIRYNNAVPALPVYANQVDALKDIAKERRIELAYEGHRYADVKRIGKITGEGAIRDAKDCEINGACSLEPTSYKFTLPIPGVELGANPAIAGQQNPGY